MRSCNCWALVRGLIPFLKTLSCMWSPFLWIWSLTHSISSFVAEVLSLNLLEEEEEESSSLLAKSETAPFLTALPAAVVVEERGQLHVESEERRKKKKIAATESVRTSTGTVITIPFCCVGDVTRAIRFRFVCSLAECRVCVKRKSCLYGYWSGKMMVLGGFSCTRWPTSFLALIIRFLKKTDVDMSLTPRMSFWWRRSGRLVGAGA